MLEFKGDAIVLSGETGTKLKSEIIGGYYPIWWEITSGGNSRRFHNPTFIIELNAGTGENYLEDSNKTILGSSGHALDLKASGQLLSSERDTSYLTLILIENNGECFEHLKKVIAKRWPSIACSTDPKEKNGNVYTFNDDLETSLGLIKNMRLGNSIFFFDPLLFTPWSDINNVAKSRIKTYYKTGTEFIVFLFTSDWFTGRGELAPLPTVKDSSRWTDKQRSTVNMIDSLFANEEYKNQLINGMTIEERIEKMVEIYRKKLHIWFRYVLPLPFQPKPKQIYHLFFCTNYERGLAITRDFYRTYTGNPKYLPSNDDAYSKFRKLHPEKDLGGNKRSLEWKILWTVIKDHEEGICDIECPDLVQKEKSVEIRRKAFNWLESHNYIKEKKDIAFEWRSKPKIYHLQWYSIEMQLGIVPPDKLKPLFSKHIK